MFAELFEILCLWPDKDRLLCDNERTGAAGPNRYIGASIGSFKHFKTRRFRTISAAFSCLRDRLPTVAAAATMFSAVGASAAPSFVQGNYGVSNLASSTVTAPYTKSQIAGDLNVVVVGWSDTAANVSSVTDTMGNVYQLAVGPTQLSGAASQSIFYAKNIVPGTAGANAVTVTFNTAATYPDVRILEYGGISSSSPIDVFVGAATGDGTQSDSGSVTTTNATDLLVSANYVLTSTSGPGLNFTQRLLTVPDGDIAQDRVVSATGTYSATAPLAATGWSVMQMVAFRAAPNPTPTPTPTPATPKYVQGNSILPLSAQAVTVPYTVAQGSGDLNAVVIGWGNSANISSVTDTMGNVYQLAVGPTQLSGSASQSIFYAANIAPAAAGGNAVTVTFDSSAIYIDIRVLEYSGIDPLNPIDVSAAATGNTTTSSSGGVTTTNATDLLFGANYVQTYTAGPGTGYTQRLLTVPNGDIAEDSLVNATANYAATAPLAAPGWWVTQMVAFRAANGQSQTSGSSTLTLAWDANAATGDASTNPVGYRLHTGTVSGLYTQTNDVGSTTGATVSSLTSGSTYYFVVGAYNIAGVEGPYSNEVSYKAP